MSNALEKSKRIPSLVIHLYCSYRSDLLARHVLQLTGSLLHLPNIAVYLLYTVTLLHFTLVHLFIINHVAD